MRIPIDLSRPISYVPADLPRRTLGIPPHHMYRERRCRSSWPLAGTTHSLSVAAHHLYHPTWFSVWRLFRDVIDHSTNPQRRRRDLGRSLPPQSPPLPPQ